MHVEYFETALDHAGIDVLADIDGFLDRRGALVEADTNQQQYRHQIQLVTFRAPFGSGIPDYARITGMETAPFDTVYYFLEPQLDVATTMDRWSFTATIDAWHTLFGNVGASGLVTTLRRGSLVRSNIGGELLGTGEFSSEPAKPYKVDLYGESEIIKVQSVCVAACYNTADQTPRKIVIVFPATLSYGETAATWGLVGSIARAHDLAGGTITHDAEAITLDSLFSINILPGTAFGMAPQTVQAEDRPSIGDVLLGAVIGTEMYFSQDVTFPASDPSVILLWGNQTSHITIPAGAKRGGGAYLCYVDGRSGTISLQVIYGEEKLDITPTTEVSIYTPASAEEQLLSDIRDIVSISTNVAGSVATTAAAAAGGAKIGASLGSSFGPWGAVIGAGVGLVAGGARLYETAKGVEARKDGMIIQSNSQGVTSCFYIVRGAVFFTGIVSCVPAFPLNRGALLDELRLYGTLTGGIRIDSINIGSAAPPVAGHTFFQIDGALIPQQRDQFLRASVEASLARGVRIWDNRLDKGGYMDAW